MVNFNSPVTIAQNVSLKIGVDKCKSGFCQIMVLGILAGVFIAFGAQLATRLSALVTFDQGISALVFGTVFSIGLMLVVIAGAELFTGYDLVLMSGLSKEIKIGMMLWKWLLVYLANFLGSIMIVWFMHLSGLVTGTIAEKAMAIAAAKVILPISQTIFRAIMCNWLVCLAIWLALASHDVAGKIFGTLFPIMAFVASGFEHSIANMYFIPIGILADKTGSISWSGFVLNIIPVTFGNIIGGAGFVAFLYWLVYRKCDKIK